MLTLFNCSCIIVYRKVYTKGGAVVDNATNTYLKDYTYLTGATVWTELYEELELERRIIEEQGECITYNLNDLGQIK